MPALGEVVPPVFAAAKLCEFLLVGVILCRLLQVAIGRKVCNQASCPKISGHKFFVSINGLSCHGNKIVNDDNFLGGC